MRRQLLGAGLLAMLMPMMLSFSACGQDTPSTNTSSAAPAGSSSSSMAASRGEPIPVVASTNVYGNIAEAIGGDAVQVTSIISNPEQDPHSYQASTQVMLQLSKARLVIENGGGYDDFVDTMIAASKNTPTVLNAVAVSGLKAPAGGELNEHVWYSLPGVKKVADRIAVELGQIDPSQGSQFSANAAKFKSQVDQLIASQAKLKSTYAGQGVGLTEPVPVYLLDAIGLDNLTPAEFSEAVEEGDDVSAAVLKETLDLYTNQEVEALVYNAQTSGPVTEQVKAAAVKAGIAVVAVTETLPQGETYLTWMQSNIDSVGRALSQK